MDYAKIMIKEQTAWEWG